MTSVLPARRLIPRWRPTGGTLQQKEAAATTQSKSVADVRENLLEFQRSIELWRATKAPGVLGDVLSFSVDTTLVGRVLEVGDEALKTGAEITESQARLICDLRGGRAGSALFQAVADSESLAHPFQEPMRRLRSLLRVVPDNPLALLDIAQLQASLGKHRSAERSLRAALGLAPNSRIVLRTIARFLVHANRADEAHRMVRRHARTPSDPWLMASEVALADAAGTTGTFLGKARRLLLEREAWAPAHITELAGVVAMAELSAGSLKRARAAQRQALQAPNDNVVAQAVEFQADFGIALDTPPVTRALALASEARLLQAWSTGNPEDAERNALAWHAEEPFSSRPIQLLTALYAYRGQFERAARWAKAGLLTDPDDRGLLVNLAYTYARWGELKEAEDTIRRLRHLHPKTSEPFAKATEGLIAYSRGLFDIGDHCYDDATQLFAQANERSAAAYCRANQALSALDCEHPRLAEIVGKANELLYRSPSPDSLMLLRTRATAGISQKEEQPRPLRRLSQWVFDPERNTLTERPSVTPAGASPIVILDS